MRRNLGWLLCLSLAACGRAYDVGPFGRYVRDFKTQAGLHGHPVTIEDLEIAFGDVPDGMQGYCTFTPHARFDWTVQVDLVPVVRIKQSAWDADDDWGKEALMIHELGHCLLGRSHDARWIDDEDRPLSVMYPKKFSSQKYRENRDYYWDELFHPAP